MWIRIGLAARLVGVCTKTLRRWETKGILMPHRSPGNHRRYHRKALEEFLQTGVYQPHYTEQTTSAIYARVSSKRQLPDLKNQLTYLKEQAQNQCPQVLREYVDIGSGLKDDRPSLLRLLKDAAQGKFARVYITYPDRLARFGTRIIQTVLTSYGIDLIILHEDQKKDPRTQIVADIVALMHSFSGKLYRLRRGKNTRA